MDFLPFFTREDFTACLSLSWMWTLSVSSSSTMVGFFLLLVVTISLV